MTGRLLFSVNAALFLAANGEFIHLELEVSRHEISDYFAPFKRITPNGNSFDFYTWPGDSSIGFSYGLIDEAGENVSAWSLKEGGLGSSFLRPIPDDQDSFGAYFLREETAGFGVFDKDTLEPLFVKEAQVPETGGLRFHQMQPLESGRAGFQIRTAQGLQFIVIGKTGELELDLTVNIEERLSWFRFQPVSESLADDGYFLNWQVSDRVSDRSTITTIKCSANGTPEWIKNFNTPYPGDLQDRHFPTPDGGFLYAVSLAETQTFLVKINSDGQLGFARSINLRLDDTSSFKITDQSIYLSLEDNDFWHLLEMSLTTGELLNSVAITGSDEIFHSQIVAISGEEISVYLEETMEAGVAKGHLVTLDHRWQVSDTRSFESNGDPFGPQFYPNITASVLRDGSMFLSLIDPVRRTLHGFTFLDSLPTSLASFIREIEAPLSNSKSDANSDSVPLQLNDTASSTVTQGTTQLRPAISPVITRVNIGFAVPASEHARLQTRIEQQQDGLRIIFKSRIGCSYQLWNSDQLQHDFWNTGESLEGTGDEVSFEIEQNSEQEFFKIKEVIQPERK